jgi:hypothetical protein
MPDAKETETSTNPIVWLLRAIGRNGPTAGSYRLVTGLFLASLSGVSILGYRELTQYDDRQASILRLEQANAIEIATVTAALRERSDDWDRQRREIVEALNAMRLSIGDVERRQAASDGRLNAVEGEMQYWRSPASNAHR